MEVFIVKPHKHGNGGWCGKSVIAKTTLEEALLKKPNEYGSDFDEFPEDEFEDEFASELRICYDENPNHVLYIEKAYTNTWVKS